jgi:hypothetical protein
MTKILIVLGIILVVAGGSLTAISDSGDADNSTGGGSEISTEIREAPVIQSEATPTPVAAPVTNRQDCNAIRGHAYLSPEERTWFLSNCVAR